MTRSVLSSLLSAYDTHLRQAARHPVRAHLRAFNGVLAPWAIVTFIGTVGYRLVGGPLGAALAVLLLLLFAIGAGWATFRFNMHGREFDRTPPDAPWVGTDIGQRLITALSRVTLNALTTVTLETRLREDLKLNSRDMSELFDILEEEGKLPARVVERGGNGGLTVSELLEGMQAGAPRTETG